MKGAIEQDGMNNAFGWVGGNTEGFVFVNGREFLLMVFIDVSGESVRIKSYLVVQCDLKIFESVNCHSQVTHH